jgi:hypothetical protein
MADLQSQDASGIDVLTRLKAKLVAIGTLPEIGRLDTVEGIEQTIVHLQERLATMQNDPMTTSQVSVLRPMWDEIPAGFPLSRGVDTVPMPSEDPDERDSKFPIPRCHQYCRCHRSQLTRRK